MGTLIVLRHAKAAHGLGMADADRPLTGRGQRDAEAAGRHLRDLGLAPALVLCSPATRTRQTLDGLRLGPESKVSYEPRIYDNDVDLLVELVRATGGDAGSLLLIGHNPSLHQLVVDLGATDVDHFPTSACAVLAVDGPWSDLTQGAAALSSYWTPKLG
ncbi:MAG TPA: histidine phosphatase family protein [Streptosporangiaceae bacterium]